MRITIKNNYLIFPVNTLATGKRLTFRQDNKTVYDLNIKIDYFNPNFYAYIDVSRFIGQTVDVSVNPQIKLDFRVSDEIDIDNLYNEPMRPQIHFTTKNGWINDPNGLIFIDGTYHMFYQYNPTESNWDNMHWGHATSTDLLHWTEQKTALFPDERGTMFSGCGILDEKNLLGKNTDTKKAALLYYTTTAPFAQCLSYSTDGFETIERYADTPIIPHIIGGNRDPKVIFCDELDCYIMALYLDGDIYCIFKSDDLVNWKELQRISLPGDNECPDIFPLESGDGNRRWVISGAHGRYLVGNFDKGIFEPEQEAISQHYGDSAYAAQTFSNLPNGRIVQIAWDRWNIPAIGFNGQMGIPTELSLNLFDGTYYLEARPIKEIEALYNTSECYENIKTSCNNDFSVQLKDTPYIFEIEGMNNDCGVTEMQVFGRKIQFNFNKNEITIGKNSAPITLTTTKNNITINPAGDKSKHRTMVMLTDLENLDSVELSLEKYIGDGSVYCPEYAVAGTLDRPAKRENGYGEYCEDAQIYAYPPVYAMEYSWHLEAGEEKTLTQTLSMPSNQADGSMADKESALKALAWFDDSVYADSLCKHAINKKGYFNSVFNDDGKWLFSDCDPDGKERPYGPANWYPIACRAVPEERVDGVFAVMDLLKSEYGYRLYYPAIGEPPIDKVGRCASGDVPAYMGENGNAYNQGSHGYLARALAVAGRGDELFDVMKWMLPCYQEKHPTYAALAAPYAIVNCWQELPSFKHRAMLSFLTGSVAMCVRGAYEWMGGVEPVIGGIEIDPCIPDDWNEMSLSLSYKGRQLNISIKRTGAEKLTVNGTEVIKSAPTDNRYNGFYSVPDSMLGTAENALMIEI